MDAVMLMSYDPIAKLTIWCGNVVDGKPVWTSDFAYAAHLSPSIARDIVAASHSDDRPASQQLAIFPMKLVRL